MKSAERFGTSDTELATIITSILIDRKIITKDATSEIVDRNVVRHQRKLYAIKIQHLGAIF